MLYILGFSLNFVSTLFDPFFAFIIFFLHLFFLYFYINFVQQFLIFSLAMQVWFFSHFV